MSKTWVNTLKSAKKSAIIQDGRRKIHFVLSDGVELCEEYDVKTNLLIVRKWRRKSNLGGVKQWEVEIGESEAQHPLLVNGKEHIVENNSNPICTRIDTKRNFQWRIRNLPYPLNVYNVQLSEDGYTIVVRTSNRKYFKQIQVPDMKRSKLKMSRDKLTFSHANNTLIIQYQKPKEILEDHDVLVKEFSKMKLNADGDADCKQS